jgi:hypothetical protein
MSIAGKILQGAVRAVAEELRNSKSDVHRKVGEHLDACKVLDCDKFSLGGVCSLCSRHACTGHLYLTASIPPVLKCVECIVMDVEVNRERRGTK